MYILIKDNIERIVDNDIMKDKLILDGYRLFVKEEKEDKKKKVTKKLG